MENKVICPDCGGDGKDTCHNPDHGFYGMISFTDEGRIGCPACGHDPNNKVRRKGAYCVCETCNGTGICSEDVGNKFLAANPHCPDELTYV